MPLTPKKEPPYYTTTAGSNLLTLTDTQIKTIPTTGHQILPAPGNNKFYKILSATIITNSTAGAYVFTGDAWLFLTTNDPDWPLLSTWCQWSGGTANISVDHIPVPYTSASTSDIIANAAPFNKYADLINLPILLRDWNISSNYTGGNAANTMKIQIDYLTLQI